MILLDTDVISRLRRVERMPNLAAWIAAQDGQGLCLSAITIGEISRGIALRRRDDPGFARDLDLWLARTAQLFGDRIIPFGAEEARVWGELAAETGNQTADMQIAATARVHGATLATFNRRHFAPIGLALADLPEG